ncbi:uncharacterized protein [Henckelia pumila]|uniref:uncharacterized protein n=1 Tax=Henckelia pumila TaxID=405737 RepID=UPI003C6E4842
MIELHFQSILGSISLLDSCYCICVSFIFFLQTYTLTHLHKANYGSARVNPQPNRRFLVSGEARHHHRSQERQSCVLPAIDSCCSGLDYRRVEWADQRSVAGISQEKITRRPEFPIVPAFERIYSCGLWPKISYCIINHVIYINSELAELVHNSKDTRKQLFANIVFPPPNTAQWEEQIRRLCLLLTVKESAMDVPTNLEAHRRIAFFSNLLFMNMPRAPRVRKMLSFRSDLIALACAFGGVPPGLNVIILKHAFSIYECL